MLSGAMDIEINARVGEEDGFPLSRALHVLIQEGLNVVDCVSSKVNQRWTYVIRCEVFTYIHIRLLLLFGLRFVAKWLKFICN